MVNKKNLSVKREGISFLLLFFSLFSFSQKKIQVLNGVTLQPIPDVIVSNSTFVTLSDRNGFVEIPYGLETLYFNHINYEPKRVTILSNEVILNQRNNTIEEILITNQSEEKLLKDAISELRENFDFENKTWGTFFLQGEDKNSNTKFILNINSITDHGGYQIIKGEVKLKNKTIDSSSVFPLIPFHYSLYHNDIFNPASKLYKDSSFKKYKNLSWEYTNNENNELVYKFNFKRNNYKIKLDKNFNIVEVDWLSQSQAFVSKVSFAKKQNLFYMKSFQRKTPSSYYEMQMFSPKIKKSANKYRGTENLRELSFDKF